MQHTRNDNLFNQMEILISKTCTNYEEFIKTKSLGYVDYPYMNFYETSIVINTFDKLSNELRTSIHSDILNIDKKNAVIGNVYQNLMRKYNLKFFNYSEDEFCQALILGLKTQYYLNENIEEVIREIFIKMLRSTIDECKDEILSCELIKYEQNIIFKYAVNKDVETSHLNNMKKIICHNVSHNKSWYFYHSYLDILIRNIIDSLLKMSDEDLASDKEFAKAMCLHILLRAVFMLLEDYQMLIPYEEYYNELEKKETRAKKIIREAFILHYNDTMNDEIKKLAKNKIVDL